MNLAKLYLPLGASLPGITCVSRLHFHSGVGDGARDWFGDFGWVFVLIRLSLCLGQQRTRHIRL
jgi:hypothetical protein